MRNKLIICDVETGGLKCKENPITQVAFVVIDPKNFAILEQFETFIKPYDNLEITQIALTKSRVTMEEINDGITHVQAMVKLIEILKRHSEPKAKPIFIGHNFTFDIGFLEHMFGLKSKDLYDYVDRFFWCTMRMMKTYDRKKKIDLSYNLETCCERFGIKLKSAHGALPDCLATRELFIGLMKGFHPEGNKAGDEVKTEAVLKSRKTFELP